MKREKKLTVHFGDAVAFGCVFVDNQGNCLATGEPCDPDDDCFIEAGDTIDPEDDGE